MLCVATCGDDHGVHDDSRSIDLHLDVLVPQETAQGRKHRPLTHLPLPVLANTEADREATLRRDRKHAIGFTPAHTPERHHGRRRLPANGRQAVQQLEP